MPSTSREPETSAQSTIQGDEENAIDSLEIGSTNLDDTSWAQHQANPLNWPAGKKNLQLGMLCCSCLLRYVAGSKAHASPELGSIYASRRTL